MLEGSIQAWDARRNLIIPGETEASVSFAAEHWIHTAKRAIQHKGRFAVALSGGSTPKAIYTLLASKYLPDLDWTKVHLFWSDERNVPLDHQESNYRMAMESGLSTLPIPRHQIHPFKSDQDLEKCAQNYEELIQRLLGPALFDMVMLGMGEDGHTASLFPHTKALLIEDKLAAANHLPQTNQLRLTLTRRCINQSAIAVFYILGASKQAIVPLVLNAAILSPFPASSIGTEEHPSFWILDRSAARLL